HPAVLLLPLVIGCLGDLVLATNFGHRPSCFYCFQNRDDLTLTELASLHKVSFGPAMLPRKPLLFNGPVFGEGYSSTSCDDALVAHTCHRSCLEQNLSLITKTNLRGVEQLCSRDARAQWHRQNCT